MRADDALKYAVAMLTERTEWVDDAIGQSAECSGHEFEMGFVHGAVAQVRGLASAFGDPGRYADGRAVESRIEIKHSFTILHIWHPDPMTEGERSFRGQLSSDPGVPCPGTYEVSTDPITQDIRVQVVNTE